MLRAFHLPLCRGREGLVERIAGKIERGVPPTNPFLPTSPLSWPSPSMKGSLSLCEGERGEQSFRIVPLTPSGAGDWGCQGHLRLGSG